MEYFDFTLRFDDEAHSFTSKNGLSIDKLAELLLAMSKAVNSDEKSPLILSEIRGNCYAIQVSTPIFTVYENLKVVHLKISDNDYSVLNQEQQKYAAKLKSVLGEKITLSAYDKSDFKVELNEIILPQKPEYYYEIGSIYGLITGIGGTTVGGKSYIRVSKISYEIEVSQLQENQLINYYKKSKIRFLVRKKISAEKKDIVSASLESFQVVGGIPFSSVVSEFRKSVPDSFYDSLKQDYNIDE